MESQVSVLREESIMGSRGTKIRRVQLEEDPGRLIYDTSFYTLIDYNRAGVSLVEIVTEPDFAEPKDVRMFLNKITSIIEHLGVGDTKLDGSVRCDVNVSIEGGKESRSRMLARLVM